MKNDSLLDDSEQVTKGSPRISTIKSRGRRGGSRLSNGNGKKTDQGVREPDLGQQRHLGAAKEVCKDLYGREEGQQCAPKPARLSQLHRLQKHIAV